MPVFQKSKKVMPRRKFFYHLGWIFDKKYSQNDIARTLKILPNMNLCVFFYETHLEQYRYRELDVSPLNRSCNIVPTSSVAQHKNSSESSMKNKIVTHIFSNVIELSTRCWRHR